MNIKTLNQRGIVLTELLFTIFIVSFVFGIVYSSFLLNQKASRVSVKKTELAQNGRAIIERISREIRQAKVIVTVLPDQESEATDTIIFEDGHVSDSYHYIRYFKENNFIKREIFGYYFSFDPSQELVPWNSIPPSGSLVKYQIETEEVIGEYVNVFDFWGSKPIYISLELEKESEFLKMKNSIFPRNL